MNMTEMTIKDLESDRYKLTKIRPDYMEGQQYTLQAILPGFVNVWHIPALCTDFASQVENFMDSLKYWADGESEIVSHPRPEDIPSAVILFQSDSDFYVLNKRPNHEAA